eukprot:g21928.t1
MTSDVHRRLVLCPLLFVIYINDLNENEQGMVSKFAGDTKIDGIVDSKGYQKLQQDLDQLGKCAEYWQMEFDIDKCDITKSNQ